MATTDPAPSKAAATTTTTPDAPAPEAAAEVTPEAAAAADPTPAPDADRVVTNQQGEQYNTVQARDDERAEVLASHAAAAAVDPFTDPNVTNPA